MQNKISFKIERKLTEEESAAVEVVKILQDKGFEAYFAGGAVRDEILNIPAYDIDIATNAKPDEIQKIFPENFGKGKSFGVIVVKKSNFEFEVATFRSDKGIKDHRRPEEVEYTTAKNDALRRDFTINGIFYDPIKQIIIDYVEGLKDIKNKTINFIGKAEERIDEDYLRILRAIRFSARFNFKISKESMEAIKKNVSKVSDISPERIREELNRILKDDHRTDAIGLLENTGLLKELLPELEATKNIPQPPEFHFEGSVWHHIMLALQNVGKSPSLELIWAVLLHDIAKPETLGYRSQIGKTSITFFDHDVRSAEKAKIILERLRFSHGFVDNVIWVISQHMRIVNAFRGMSERKQQKLFCDSNIRLLLDLTYADLSASLRPTGKPDLTMYQEAVKLKERFESESSNEELQQARKFDLITGYDIIQNLTLEPGPEVGTIKKEIERAYLEGKINTRADAVKMLEKFKK